MEGCRERMAQLVKSSQAQGTESDTPRMHVKIKRDIDTCDSTGGTPDTFLSVSLACLVN